MKWPEVVVILIFIFYPSGSTTTKSNKVCLTTACNKTAALIKSNLDETVNPCEDFVSFVCGGAIKKPRDNSKHPYFNHPYQIFLNQLEKALNRSFTANEPKPLQYIKDFYKLCMDTQKLEKDGLETAKRVLKQLGGWPSVEGKSWDERKFDWKTFTYKLRQSGLPFDTIVGFHPVQSVHNVSKPFLKIYPGKLEVPYFSKAVNSPFIKNYHNFLMDLGVRFGGKKEVVDKELKEALDLEINLAKLKTLVWRHVDVTRISKVMNLETMQKEFPSIPWKEFLSKLIDNPKYSLSSSSIVRVYNLRYFKELENLLLSTPKRVQANYLAYRAVISLVPYFPETVRIETLQLLGIKPKMYRYTSRFTECALLTTNRLPFAAAALYTREYFSKPSQNKVEELVKNIMTTFKSMLSRLKWMDETTKRAALEKASAFDSHLGQSKELIDDESVNNFHIKLSNPVEHTLIDYALTTNKFLVDKRFEHLEKPFNVSDWTNRPLMEIIHINFINLQSSIGVPLALLQSPFYETDRPNYVNYASAGYLIGRRLTHGFDDVGGYFDKRGRLNRWWTKETSVAYNKRVKCFSDQYKNYTDSKVNRLLFIHYSVRGSVADSGGYKTAYIAYNEWVKTNGEEPSLQGLKYTPNQLFWVSAGSMWCNSLRTEKNYGIVSRALNSITKFRLISSVVNNNNFVKDFNCPSGSKMNPSSKCEVW